MSKKISIIVAVANNNAIGKDNKLLCHLSDDLKRFKLLTTGNTVIMGENTFESLPVKPLSNRTNIVISHIPGKTLNGCIVVNSIEEALNNCDDTKENFIIGGSSVYNQFLPFANKLYLTKINKNFDADCFFPEIDYTQWKLISSVDFEPDEKNDFSYSYLIYERVKNSTYTSTIAQYD
ncbi:MAG: dihydrofolate reductase [Bacteroidetes bacterium]|nr:dihydrofolate reductase [Bacteroidota bacterium]